MIIDPTVIARASSGNDFGANADPTSSVPAGGDETVAGGLSSHPSFWRAGRR
jgi:hypothetical protein